MRGLHRSTEIYVVKVLSLKVAHLSTWPRHAQPIRSTDLALTSTDLYLDLTSTYHLNVRLSSAVLDVAEILRTCVHWLDAGSSDVTDSSNAVIMHDPPPQRPLSCNRYRLHVPPHTSMHLRIRLKML